MQRYFILIVLFFLFSFSVNVEAKTIKMVAQTQNDFSTEKNTKNLTLKIIGNYEINDTQYIPNGIFIKGDIVKITPPKRGKRGAVAYLLLKSYTMPNGKTYLVNNPDAIGKITAYKPLDIKSKSVDIGITAAGLLVEHISYPINFVRGVINAEEDENKFKSGIEFTYKKSIFSFISKGQHINVPEGNQVIITLKYKNK